MEEQILVSIVTPCLNAEKTIRKTIEAVVNQTYRNIEYWIIDGESTDGTLDIIREYLTDERVHLISEKDAGIYDAMNKGIKHATGQIVGIINSDDWYEPDAVAHMAAHYREDQMTFQYGMLNECNEIGCYMTWISYHNNVDNKTIPHPTCFVDRRIYEKYGCFDTGFRICADREFMMRCVRKDDIVFVPHQKVIANFLDGGMSTSSKAAKRLMLEIYEMKHRYGLISDKTFKKRKLATNIYYGLQRLKNIGKGRN